MRRREDSTHRQLGTVAEHFLRARHGAKRELCAGSQDLPQPHQVDPVIISKVPDGKSEADHLNDLPHILSKHKSGFTPGWVGLVGL